MCVTPPLEDAKVPASDREIFGVLEGKMDPDTFLGLFGVTVHLIWLAFSCVIMEWTEDLLTPLEPRPLEWMDEQEGGDFFCPMSSDKMSDIENGEE